jgi:uncharacterized protein (TIGR00369 family)
MDGSVAPAPIFDVLNMRIDAFGPGWIEFSIVPQPYMLNIAGTLHGGVLATVLDSALTCALVTQLPAGLACATTDFQVRFFRPVRIPSSALVARAEVINAGRRLTTAQATASTTDGKLIAHSTGTLAVGPVAKFLIPR